MKLKKLTICGFRGFNRLQSISLDNNIVLVYGLNGTGKSGLVEALEWLFYDEFSRKTRSLCKSEYTSDCIKNVHYDEVQNPYVELIILKEGEEIKLKKELISATRCKFLINDVDVSDFSSLGISFDLIHKPILGQSEIKRFVDTEQKDRWEEISKILGLEELAGIRVSLLTLRKEIENDPKYVELVKLKDSIEYDIEETQFLGHLLGLVNMSPYKKGDFKTQLTNLLKQEFKQQSEDLEFYKKLLEDKVNFIIKISSNAEKLGKINYEQDKELELVIPELVKKGKILITEINAIKEFKFNEADFIRKGMELIEGDVCPFCRETTITEKKKQHLKDCLGKQKELLDKHKLFTEIRDELQRIKTDFLGKLIVSMISADDLNLVIEELSKYPEYKENIKKLISFSHENLKSFFQKINNVSLSFDGFIKLLEDIPTTDEKLKECKDFVDMLEDNLNTVIADTIKEGNNLNKIKEELLIKTPGLSDEDKKSLNKNNAILKIIKNLNKLDVLGAYHNSICNLTLLVDNVEKFEKEKAESLLKNLSDSIKQYYHELNPHEKVCFEEIVPSAGKSRKARIRGVSYGKEINPISCFSESHTNCLGLSLYFPQRVDKNPDWKFILLDDPVQSMDINHSKNLIRILKRIANDKQVIVLSHSLSFKQDFEDLFYDKSFLSYEFSEYDIDGPKITLQKGNIGNCLEYATKLAHGTATERNIAGSSIRKALENFTAEFLIYKCGLGISRVNNMKLDERIIEIEESKHSTTDDISEIKALLNVLDPASHGRPRREVSTAEILDGIKLIVGLKEKCLSST